MKSAVLLSLLLLWVTSAHAAAPESLEVPQFGSSPLYLPAVKKPAGFIALLSPGSGWNDAAAAEAERLMAANYIVLGLDVKTYFTGRAASHDTCLYPSGIIEEQSEALQRRYRHNDFYPPTIIGLGDSGGLAAAIVLQTLPSTYNAAIAPHFCASVSAPKPLCTGTRLVQQGRGYQPKDIHAVEQDEDLFLALDPSCAADRKAWPAVGPVPDDAAFITDSLQRDATDDAAAGASFAGLADVPLTLLPANGNDWLVVFVSGDGGWRDIDRQIGTRLQQAGYAVAGLDSLHYFWQKKSPAETAATLDRIIQKATTAWQKKRVALMGYSFGADVLPQVLGQMHTAPLVRNMTLIAFNRYPLFEITAGGFFGVGDTGYDNLKALHALSAPPPTLCIYGKEEAAEDTLCPALADLPWVSRMAFPGAHHFNRDYRSLTNAIIEKLGD